jgi:hypothetical protein
MTAGKMKAGAVTHQRQVGRDIGVEYLFDCPTRPTGDQPATQLVTRKSRPVDQCDAQTGTRRGDGRCRSGGAGTDNGKIDRASQSCSTATVSLTLKAR